ncbi:MAG: hypothetical protein NZM40_07995 [Sphingomonadaceae bacterium]|uniref:hypothetical protein n=1 Tax=Thermaurantiacus sp. TaxID=2820283 RepID=UPI00298EFD4F|nr:hypothetical protein [Thermaurantiacus sp.]MCS6987352.1 hypothetical protein [Sphingomonadaceae bacterium]MDW8414573.1 hypothetical protein [Thermaurantiacus sp.]
MIAAFAVPAAGAPEVPAHVTAEQRRACRDDAFRLCPGQVALMRREGVRRCLKAQAEKLSPACRGAFRALGPPRGEERP